MATDVYDHEGDVEALADVAPERRERFDDPEEVLRDLVQLHVAKKVVGLTRSQFRRYVVLVERRADLTGADLAAVGSELQAVAG